MDVRDDGRRVVEADKAWSIEQHAILPIPAADRHGTPVELFRLWPNGYTAALGMLALRVDYFLRGGHYDHTDLMRWGGGRYWFDNGTAWPGLVAFVVGIVASVACSNSPSFESPLAQSWLGGADLSFEVGLLLPALLYYLMARHRLGRPVAAATPIES
jgi:cytosine/uracil/thiamine/allantoin permease